jgi:ABC-type nitrate/sulfonate/bicarbonate transport system substrate-binding protein
VTVRRLVRTRSASTARLTRVVLVALVIGSFAALGSTALGGSTAGGGATATGAKSALITPARCKRNAAAGTINYISPFGYDAAATIMEVFMAEKLGYFKALCLKVAFNASSFTAEQLVSSGRGQVTAIGSAADHVLAAAAGANLTAVATYGDTDPHAIYAQPKIKSLKDLEGGTLGYHINVTPAAVAMLDKAGADVSKVKMILLTSYDPTVVTRGQIDAAVGFASNEPLQLKAAGTPFNEFRPGDFGIKGTYGVMQWNTTFYRKHRAAVADFMRADLKALGYCLAHKVTCVRWVSHLASAANQGAAFPYGRQLATWNFESQYVTNTKVGGYGVQTLAEWQTEYQEVLKYGKLAGLTESNKIPPLASVLDTKLVAGLYRGKKLIWPGT